jgi:uncharacterized membrane-anchored protein
MKQGLLILLAVVAVVQLAVPGWMIFRRERTLDVGEAYRFATAPVDPYDAFRGRYVALQFAAASVTNAPVPPDLRRGEMVYASLREGGDGFVEVNELHRNRPESPHLRVRVRAVAASGSVRIDLPFDRFYIEEPLAPAAEALYRERGRGGGSTSAWAVVRVRNGFGVLEELVVDGRPIRDVAASRVEESVAKPGPDRQPSTND